MRTRTTRLWAVAAVLALVAACGGGDGGSEDAARDEDATTTSAADGATTTTAAEDPGGGGAGASGDDPAPATTAAPSAAGGGSQPASGGASGQAQALTPPQPGTYRYRVTGTATFGPTPQDVNETSTLVVDPPQGNRQRSVQRSSQGTTTTVLEYRGDGVHLAELVIEQAGVRLRFAPAQPVLAVPVPAGVGQAWAFDLASDDGCHTSHTDASVADDDDPVDVGGRRVSAAVLDLKTTLSPTGKQGCSSLSANQETRMWASAEHRLVVKEEDRAKGTFSGLQFSSQTTSVLQSTTPS
jgi:hypothetical protein